MDASASKGDAEINNLLGLYLKLDNLSYPSHINQNKSVIKYTRIPDFDEHSRVSWPQKSYSLEPRLRRIVMIEEPRLETNRSLKSQVALPSRKMSSDICKRQVIAIEEDTYSLHPKFSQNVKKPHHKKINRAIETESKEEKQSSQRKLSKLNYSSRSYKRSSRTTVTSNNDKKEVTVSKMGHKYNTCTKGDTETRSYDKSTRSNEIAWGGRNANVPSKMNIKKRSQTIEKEVEKENSSIKSKGKDNFRKTSHKRTVSEKTKSTKSTVKYNHNKVIDFDGVKGLHQPVSVIHVPLDVKPEKHDKATSPDILNINDNHLSFVDSSVQVINNTNLKDVMVETELWPRKVDQVTEIDETCLYDKSFDNVVKNSFDSLDIPNVSLMNKRSALRKEEVVDVINTDNIIFETSPINNCKRNKEKVIESHYHKNASYIISRATVTYTTRQKIDFHVVGNNEVLQSHLSSEPCNYPLKVVSVFKQEMNKQENKDRKKHYVKKDDDKHRIVKDLTPINCSYVFDNHRLVKPSDIISTIKVNSSLLHRNYICEQFQRELNFIDSFFESLQYLENCSLNENSITEKKVENFINSGRDLSNIEFGSFLSKVENEVNIDDTDTMASKNLCLLNLLIRDEQKRAKRILIVLKMREDALKDFTKSQILWLENKKKQDNIDISTLKKKQRGALLKLQQECGEMQRMRKALLAVLEKRKLALMKTKKNIELKLRSSLDLDQIIMGKKKLRRSISADRAVAPVKCFELSSSGCDDSTTSRPKSAPILLQNVSKSITSAEKCVQTGDSITTTRQIDQSTNTADENFVVVDGGYLNILFHNLSLPQIFSGGKQYEVNQEALKNIVQTSNMHHVTNNDIMIEELMEQIKDLDRSSTPSTARSLVEEFDQIYKGLAEEEKLKHNSEQNCNSVIEEIKDCAIEISHVEEESDKSRECDMIEYVEDILSDDPRVDVSCTCELPVVSVGASTSRGGGGSGEVTGSVAGPLPVPAGAAAPGDDADVTSWLNQSSSPPSQDDSGSSSGSGGSSQTLCSAVSSLATPVQFEAQELRRQQLEIEREIKALEQQQCQLLALREIPDKPPPPYTPPAETKPKIPRNFTVDKIAEHIIKDVITESNSDFSSTDPFDIFVGDYCEEAIEKQKLEKNEKYWDTCNFSPSKTPLNTEKFIQKTVTDLKDVLTSVQPTVVSGVGARRSDHIDDILFAEWRRCEPEWTSLHADDVIVKNQVFESIFQKILTETIDEYKKTVVAPEKCTDE